MDNFSTQYLPSNAGLIRAVPLMQRALKTGSGLYALLFFVVGLVLFFLVGLADVLLPRYLPGTPAGLTFAIACCLLFAALSLGVLTPWMRRRATRRFDRLLPPVLTHLSTDDSVITIADELSHGFWDWRLIPGAIVTPDGIAILMGYSGIDLPAAAFRDAGEQAAVVALINRRSNRTPL